MSDPIRILINVEGGVVQSVYTSLTTPGRIEVFIRDLDEEDADASDMSEEDRDEMQEFIDSCLTPIA